MHPRLSLRRIPHEYVCETPGSQLLIAAMDRFPRNPQISGLGPEASCTEAGARRRAVLVFAEAAGRARIRRRLPRRAAPLLGGASFLGACGAFADVHYFRATADTEPPHGNSVHDQVGRTFGQRFDHAIATLLAAGYDEIVAVGGDCPGLARSDIEAAFAELRSHELVLGPDHRGGCYLIGFRSCARQLLRGVRWNRNRDCAELRARCGETGAFLLPVKQDIDSDDDLRLLARAQDWFGALARFVLATYSPLGSCLWVFVDLAAQRVRVQGQIPPPRALA